MQNMYIVKMVVAVVKCGMKAADEMQPMQRFDSEGGGTMRFEVVSTYVFT